MENQNIGPTAAGQDQRPPIEPKLALEITSPQLSQVAPVSLASSRLTKTVVSQMAPYSRSFPLGGGGMNPEVLALLLTRASVRELAIAAEANEYVALDDVQAAQSTLAEQVDSLANVLRDRGEIHRFIHKLVPNATTRVRKNSAYTSAAAIRGIVHELYEGVQSHQVRLALAELLTAALSSLGMVAPSVPMSLVAYRSRRFMSSWDLHAEALQEELTTVFERSSITPDVGAQDFSEAVLTDALHRVFSELADKLSQTLTVSTDLIDVLTLLRMKLQRNYGDVRELQLDPGIMDHPSLSGMTENVVLVNAAAEQGVLTLISPAFRHTQAIERVNKILNSSQRYKVVSLPEALASVRVTPIVNQLGGLSAMVVTNIAAIRPVVRAGLARFSPILDELHFVRLRTEETMIARGLGQPIPVNAGDRIHDASVIMWNMMPSVDPCAETNETAIASLALPPLEKEAYEQHLAAMASQQVYMEIDGNIADEDDVGAHPLVLTYGFRLPAGRLLGPAPVMSETMFTTDPRTAWVGLSEKDATSPLSPEREMVDDRDFDKVLVGVEEHQTRDYDREVRARFVTTGEGVWVNLKLSSLLGLPPRQDARVMTLSTQAWYAYQYLCAIPALYQHLSDRYSSYRDAGLTQAGEREFRRTLGYASGLQLISLLDDQAKTETAMSLARNVLYNAVMAAGREKAQLLYPEVRRKEVVEYAAIHLSLRIAEAVGFFGNSDDATKTARAFLQSSDVLAMRYRLNFLTREG